MKVWDITSFVNVGGLEQSANVRELHHWRAHAKAVSSLDFIERKQLLLSASLDAKVRADMRGRCVGDAWGMRGVAAWMHGVAARAA